MLETDFKQFDAVHVQWTRLLWEKADHGVRIGPMKEDLFVFKEVSNESPEFTFGSCFSCWRTKRRNFSDPKKTPYPFDVSNNHPALPQLGRCGCVCCNECVNAILLHPSNEQQTSVHCPYCSNHDSFKKHLRIWCISRQVNDLHLIKQEVAEDLHVPLKDLQVHLVYEKWCNMFVFFYLHWGFLWQKSNWIWYWRTRIEHIRSVINALFSFSFAFGYRQGTASHLSQTPYRSREVITGVPLDVCDELSTLDLPKKTSTCLFCALPATRLCEFCEHASYCGKKHQKADWNTHRDVCFYNTAEKQKRCVPVMLVIETNPLYCILLD